MSSPAALRLVQIAPCRARECTTDCGSCSGDQFGLLVEYLGNVPEHVRRDRAFWTLVRNFAVFQRDQLG